MYYKEIVFMSESLVKLLSITIKRNLSINRIIKVTFSSERITVIYGENGCGKTTFLRCLSAALALNDSILSHEKVENIKISYLINNQEKVVTINKIEESDTILDEKGKPIDSIIITYDWDQFRKSELKEIKSILFGVNRGISNNIEISEEDIINTVYRSDFYERFNNQSDVLRFAHNFTRIFKQRNRRIRGRNIKSTLGLSEPTLTIDSISMNVIEELLVTRVNYAQKVSSSKVRKALFNTFADACDTTLTTEDTPIDDEEYRQLLLENKNRLITALYSEEENEITERIVGILENVGDHQENYEFGQNPLLKKLIYNMIQELNRESETLRSINKLMEVYNDYIGPDKYLEISEEAAIVKFKGSDDTHNIDALSSGEKHLLVLLTIFVIEGNKRELFMVDEPEISLNLIWQKKLLPLLHELAPNAEIIVASHSPSIAHDNTQYLVELERYK